MTLPGSTLALEFRTDATTPEGVMADLTRYALGRGRDLGRFNPDDTVLQAGGSAPADAAGFGDLLQSLYERRMQRFGGGIMGSQAYNEQRRAFLAREEGVYPAAYDDADGQLIARKGVHAKRGNVSVGIGFNMDRKDARKVWAAAGLPESFDDVYAGKTALARASVERLFDHTVLEAEQAVRLRFPGVTLRDHQRIALVSLAFNGGPSLLGPKITQAVANGDPNAIRDEWLHNSNRSRHRGLAKRRYAEATVFFGADAQHVLPPLNSYLTSYA